MSGKVIWKLIWYNNYVWLTLVIIIAVAGWSRQLIKPVDDNTYWYTLGVNDGCSFATLAFDPLDTTAPPEAISQDLDFRYQWCLDIITQPAAESVGLKPLELEPKRRFVDYWFGPDNPIPLDAKVNYFSESDIIIEESENIEQVNEE